MYLCSLSLLSLLLLVTADDSKRLLTSDPTYVHSLEINVQDLTQKISELANRLTNQETRINAQEATISAQENQLADQTKKISNQESILNSQAMEINDTKKKLNSLTDYKCSKILPGFYYREEHFGGTYVRWGRNTCPKSTSVLAYHGYAGGSLNTHSGGAADYICMPMDPQYRPNAKSSSYAFVYGAEYDLSMEGTIHRHDDVPCAVCRTVGTSSVLMIPGRTSCYSDWTFQYQGDLVAGYYNNPVASEYVCLDIQPEFVPHSQNVDWGKIFEPVSSMCGSLACPPYLNGKRLPCVVCSK